jgi:regulator of replication initiation timing
MVDKFKVGLIVCCILLVVSAVCNVWLYTKTEYLRSWVDSLLSKNHALEVEKADLQKQIDELQSRIEYLRREGDYLRAQVEDYKRQIDDLRGEVERLEDELWLQRAPDIYILELRAEDHQPEAEGTVEPRLIRIVDEKGNVVFELNLSQPYVEVEWIVFNAGFEATVATATVNIYDGSGVLLKTGGPYLIGVNGRSQTNAQYYINYLGDASHVELAVSYEVDGVTKTVTAGISV